MTELELTNASDALRATIAQHPDTPTELLWELAGDTACHPALLRNPGAPEELIVKLVTLSSPATLIDALHDPNDRLRNAVAAHMEMFDTPDERRNVALLVAAGALTSDTRAQIAQQLADDLDGVDSVIVRVETNLSLNSILYLQDIPANLNDILCQIAQQLADATDDPQVRAAGITHLLRNTVDAARRTHLERRTFHALWAVAGASDRARVLTLDDCPDELAIDAARDVGAHADGVDEPDEFRRYVCAALAHPALTDNELHELLLIVEHSADVRLAHARNPNCSTEQLDTYAQDPNADVRRAVAEHPRTATPTLVELARRGPSTIQRAALRRLEVARIWGFGEPDEYHRWLDVLDDNFHGTVTQLVDQLRG